MKSIASWIPIFKKVFPSHMAQESCEGNESVGMPIKLGGFIANIKHAKES